MTVPDWKPSSLLLNLRNKLAKMARNPSMIMEQKSTDRKVIELEAEERKRHQAHHQKIIQKLLE